MKHANAQVVTASTDSVDFLRPIKTGDITSYEAMVSYAGTSSMEVCVQIIIEDVLNKERHLAALSFLTFVALDDNGKPVKYQMSIRNQKLKNGSMKVRLSVYNVEKIEEK